MTIQKVLLPLSPQSKPRGKLGRRGNIYHRSKNYSEFQSNFHSLIKSCNFSLAIPVKDLYGIAINFSIFQNPRGGRKKDLDNLAGGVLDALVKYQIIPDDNFSIVKRLYCDGTKIQHKESAAITIYFVDSKYEWLYILDNFFQ